MVSILANRVLVHHLRDNFKIIEKQNFVSAIFFLISLIQNKHNAIQFTSQIE